MNKKLKEHLQSLSGDVVPENRDGFYRFVHERHSIWYRRFVLKQPPPWTDDPILGQFFFTNVYRELDRGTQWMEENIIRHCYIQYGPLTRLKEIFWKLVVYRLINRVETFEDVGLPSFGAYREAQYRKRLLARKAHGKPIITSAHLVQTGAGRSKIEGLLAAFRWFRQHNGKLLRQLVHTQDPEWAWQVLQRIPSVGGFVAYELYCDLVMARVLPFTLDDWASTGPGCRVGIRLILPGMAKEGRWLEAMCLLRDNQQSHFRRLGLDFPRWDGKWLNLRNIEHSLCEFGKYYKQKHGLGHIRRLYPQATGN